MKPRRSRGHAHPHDLAWRELLGHRTAIKELLCGFVPELADVVASLDFDAAMEVDMSFVEAHVRELRADVLWRIPGLEVGDCFIYFLIEHQSGPSEYMAIRLLRYIGAILGEWLDKAQDEEAEPPIVIPIVLHCAPKPWSQPPSLEYLCPTLGRLWKFSITLRYFVVDVVRLSNAALMQIGNALAGLFLLEKGRLTGVSSFTKHAVACMRGEADQSFLQAAVTTAYNIYRARSQRPFPPAVTRVLSARNREEGAMEQTMLEYLTKVGQELRLETERRNALVSLRRAFAIRGIDPGRYARQLEKLPHAGRISQLIVSFMAAKNPRAYLKRRFGR